MSAYDNLKTHLKSKQYSWLITGVAGFIGSNLLETLLKLNQKVVGLDNFSTGHQLSIDEVQGIVTPSQWQNFNFIQGDICNLTACQTGCTGVDYVLHQAALGSVPRSVEDPMKDVQAVYREFRAGDVRHSLASIDKARDRLGYVPKQSMGQGLTFTMPWHLTQFIK